MNVLKQLFYGFTLFIIYVIICGYLDFNYLTDVMPLPSDYCYYHTNPAPLWVDWFYLESSGHIEPLMNKNHLILLIIVSLSLSYLTIKKLF